MPAIHQNDSWISYEQLLGHAVAIADLIASQGGGAGKTVALAGEASVDLIAGLVGVLWAGCSYLPVPAAWPARLCQQVLSSVGVDLLLHGTGHGFCDGSLPGIRQFELRDVPSRQTFLDCSRAVSSGEGELAYILFTSGSTGIPKGVRVPHSAVCCFLDAFEQVAPAPDPLRTALFCPLSFDVSVWEIFSTLSKGGCLHLLAQEERCNVDLLVEYFQKHHITSAYIPPGLLDDFSRQLAKRSTRGFALRRLLIGVEPIRCDVIARIMDALPELEVFNGYGPTETTVCATLFRVPRDKRESGYIPIGFPLPGYRLCLEDENGQAVEPGCTGEIVISGAAVASGYEGASAADQERFRVEADGRRSFRTGDFGRCNADGVLEFCGRRDSQIKLSGYRIELGDIEQNALRTPQVQRSRALVLQTHAGVRQIVLFVQSHDSSMQDQLLGDLNARLPAYMLPTRICVLEQFPLTAHGKIDDKRLLAAAAQPAAQSTSIGKSELETAWLQIWRDVLGVPIDSGHNFFAAGGTSLQAMQAISRFDQLYGARLSYAEFAASADAAEMAAKSREKMIVGGTSFGPRLQGARLVRSAHREILALREMRPESPLFHVCLWLRVEGDFDAAQALAVLARAAAAQPLLRAKYYRSGGRLICEIESGGAVAFKECSATTGSEARRILQEQCQLPFPPDEPLFRCFGCRISTGGYLLACNFHHLVFDGGSVLPFIQSLQQSAVPVQGIAGEYSLDEESVAVSEYWNRRLQGTSSFLHVPSERLVQQLVITSPATAHMTLDERTSAGVAGLARRWGISPFAVLVAASGAVAGCYSGRTDGLVGVPVSHRSEWGMDDVVGYFVSMLPVRVRLTGGRFSQLARDVFLDLVEGTSSGAPSMAEILRRTPEEKPDLQRAAVGFTVVDEKYPEERFRIGEVEAVVEGVENPVATYEWALYVNSSRPQMRLRLEVDASLYEERTARRFLEHLSVVLTSLLEYPDLSLEELSILSAEERGALIELGRGPAANYPREKSLFEVFAEQVAANPEAVALQTPSQVISFRELYALAITYSAALTCHQVQRGDPVVLVLSPAPELIAAILAIVRIGAAYVPLERDTPVARISLLCRQLGVKCGISDNHLFESSDAMCWFTPAQLAEEGSMHSVDTVSAGPDDVAYVLFTSGSTGVPKSVGVPQRAVMRLVKGSDYTQLGPGDRFIQVSNLSFDASTLEIWGALLNGGCLVLCSRESLKDPVMLCEQIERFGITAGFFTVTLFDRMLEAGAKKLAGMHSIIVGGEAVPTNLFRRACVSLAPHTLVNGYGPTENTTFSCCYRLGDVFPEGATIPIGAPIANSSAYIVDDRRRLVPRGVIGEIIVGGDGLARGYLNDAELTAQRFIETDRVTGVLERFYLTGDFGRWRPDGSIEYLGRRDSQVKVRGCRVECGEVEAAISELAQGRRCVVLAPRICGVRQLIAFVESDASVHAETILTDLHRVLPPYMVPARLHVLQSLPMTASGKVDSQALLEVDFRQSRSASDGAQPCSPTAAALREIWASALGVGSVPLDTSFFELGGNSISIFIMRDEAARKLGVKLSMAELFEFGSINKLAAHIDGTSSRRQPVADAQRRARMMKNGIRGG